MLITQKVTINSIRIKINLFLIESIAIINRKKILANKLLPAITDCLKQPHKAIRIFFQLGYYSYLTHHRIDFRSLKHAFLLYIREGYFPKESYQYGFLSSNFTYDLHSKYLSRKKMSAIQRSINPQQWDFLTEDKSVFYFLCEKLSIPIPKLYGVFFKETPGWTFSGNDLTTPSEWRNFIDNALPDEFVIKPSKGVYGRGFKSFTRKSHGFTDENDVRYSSEEIHERMSSDKTYNSFVIQERLYNHSALTSLSGTRNLQTIRVVTFCCSTQDHRIIHASLKTIVGNNIVDNHDHGQNGNLLTEIDINSGALKRSIIMASCPAGFKEIIRHPDTGIKFSDIVIPRWNEIRDLALTAAKHFIPIKSIGWDIAITPNGIYLIEGNMWWDPTMHGNMDKIVKDLSYS